MLSSGHSVVIHRQAAVAGSFYPADTDTLEGAVKNYIEGKTATKKNSPVRAIIVPHAGYIFSGSVAGSAYAYVADWQKI